MARSWKALLLCLPLVIAGCDDDDEAPPAGTNNPPPPAAAGLIGVEDTNLLQFSSTNPGTIQGEVAMTGFVEDNPSSPPFVIGADFRPSTGVVTVLMSDNRIYNVNTTTGVASQIGTLATDPGVVLRAFNWDPVRDRIRALGSNRENYDFFPDGTLAGRDSDLHYASGDAHQADTPSVEAVSYPGGNSATTTTAYGIDATLDTLVTIGTINDAQSQDSGEVHTVADLSQPVGGAGAPPFDIETVGVTPSGYLTDTDGTETHLFRVNLATGVLTDLGEVGVDRRIQALTVVPGTSGGGGTNNPPPPPPTGGVGGDELCTTTINGIGTTVELGASSAQCVGCQIFNPERVVNTDVEDFAVFDLQLGVLLAGVPLRVHAAPGVVYPSGAIAGGVFNFPASDLVMVTVAPDLTITTYLEDEVQETTTLGGDTVILDLGGAIVDTEKFFAGMLTTEPFDAVEIFPTIGLVGAFTRLNMYSACAGAADEGAFP